MVGLKDVIQRCPLFESSDGTLRKILADAVCDECLQ